MKKRLEAELISIAHRVLKLKNKSEVDQLYKESKKLYETLAVLKFYGDNFEMLKNKLPAEELEAKLEAAFDKEEDVFEKPIEVDLSPVAEVVEEEPVIVGEITIEEDEVEDESFEDNDLVEEEDKEDHEANGAQITEKPFEPMFELEIEEPTKDVVEEVPTVENVTVPVIISVLAPAAMVEVFEAPV